MLVALKLDDRVDDVLQDLRSGQCAFLIYMAYENDGHAAGLGEAQQGRRALSHLGDASGRRVDGVGGYGLYGVYDEQLWVHLLYLGEDVLERCFAKHEHLAPGHFALCAGGAQSVGPHLYLVGALLSAYIQDVALRHAKDGLQGQRGFSYAGLAAQEDDAAWHDAAAQHAVELLVVGVDAWLGLMRDVVELHRMVAARVAHAARLALPYRQGRLLGGCRAIVGRNLYLLKRGPLAARGAFAQPLGRLVSAM